ncbi:MAG: SDR family NAD(P)-dependent oxidoreductase [Candidatus Omnitrophica bacterium]|nr:SDR family NAD(P)-dependent oxidoreductase [Candidatus Omnitrophota bacterium]
MKTKAVLITGCSSGIGLETADFLKKLGWDVFAGARKPEDVTKLSERGLCACRLDLENSGSIKEAFDFVLSKTQGSLYALVNNAGYGLTCAVEDLARDQIRRQFEVNLFGLQELTNLAIPVFRKQGFGRIVNVSSIVGRVVLPFMGAYCASKFALEALSDALRLELYGTGIHVSIIEPGSIKTRFSANASANSNKLTAKIDSPHIKAYQSIEQGRKNTNKQNRKYPAIAVSRKILHALKSKRPRGRYLVGPDAYAAAIARKILPEGVMDFILSQNLKKRGYV